MRAGANAVHGRKGRIGLIVPANNSVIEPELWSVLPRGVSLHATRILAKGDLTPQAIHRMESDTGSAVEQLVATGVDVIAYCDMVTTFIMQAGWNESTMQRFSQATGVPCISAWTALRDALAKLGTRRLAIGTPYPASIHALVAPFFQQKNFQVTSHATLDIVSMREVPTVDAARLKGFLKKLDVHGCDALVLLATDLPTFSSIASLESECGVPVLTSNQTILWRALSQLGSTREVHNLGRLFS
jgi:maleate cis-trans isomerase